MMRYKVITVEEYETHDNIYGQGIQHITAGMLEEELNKVNGRLVQIVHLKEAITGLNELLCVFEVDE